MKTAMILAAGLGSRMWPLTDTTPKLLVEVAGKPLLQYVLDATKQAGIDNLIVNVHHLADQIEIYLKNQPDFSIKISDERDELLDSGGGITHALPLISDDAFILLNADTFWIDDPSKTESNLLTLISTFNESKMDILLMCVPISRTTGHTGRIDNQGKLERYNSAEDDAMIYAGVAILYRRIFDEAIAHGRLFGYVMHGSWLTVGTVDAISEAEAVMKRIG